MPHRNTVLLGATLAAPALTMTTLTAVAAELHVSIDIPRLAVATYHRPYVALWVETPEQKFVKNLSLWHQLKSKNDEGNKYLKDLRLWWRKSGRELSFPVDGVSGASRAPGTHALTFLPDAQTQGRTKTVGIADLPAGDYHLVVEAAREAGGREVLRVPFQWPPQAEQTVQAQGATELGALAVTLKPTAQ